jgi:GntR family transcriptional regulator
MTVSIAIDTSSPVPVFMQVILRIREAVLEGKVEPGAPLPPIRQLAEDLGLNPNTVAKAYRLLERDSVIETRGRRGSFVHREARKHSRVNLSQLAVASLAEAVESLRAAGLTDSEIRIAFSTVMKE